MLFVLTGACRCALALLLCSRTPTRHALVIVRTLALTSPGPPSSHAAKPIMHRSATAVLVPGMAMIFTPFSSSLLTSARSRSIGRAQPAPHTARTEILCDPCPSFCPPSPPVPILVRPHDNVGLAATSDVSQFRPVLPSHSSRSASCRVLLPTKSTPTSINVRNPHCFHTGPVRCLLIGDSTTLTSRGSLFAVILLLLSDPDGPTSSCVSVHG